MHPSAHRRFVIAHFPRDDSSLGWLLAAVVYAQLYRGVDCDLIIPLHPVLSIKLQLGVTVWATGAIFYTICAYVAFLRIGGNDEGPEDGR